MTIYLILLFMYLLLLVSFVNIVMHTFEVLLDICFVNIFELILVIIKHNTDFWLYTILFGVGYTLCKQFLLLFLHKQTFLPNKFIEKTTNSTNNENIFIR